MKRTWELAQFCLGRDVDRRTSRQSLSVVSGLLICCDGRSIVMCSSAPSLAALLFVLRSHNVDIKACRGGLITCGRGREERGIVPAPRSLDRPEIGADFQLRLDPRLDIVYCFISKHFISSSSQEVHLNFLLFHGGS